LGIGSLLYRQSKLKSAQKQSLIEQKLLRTQMNPHFIFNSLSSIESFIYEHQPKEAGEYLAQFAKLMRLILENSSSDYISLDKEIETLKYYLTLQKLRLNDNMEFEIFVDEQIDPEDTLIPPMLTQPFIENVIEHGFRGLKECGRINIYFTKKNDILEVKITDNGIGIAQAKQQKVLFQKHKSMAIQITYERLALLNKSKRKILIFDIKDASNEGNRKGTEVLFSIPI
jgi:sensor histidine kinase YesM